MTRSARRLSTTANNTPIAKYRVVVATHRQCGGPFDAAGAPTQLAAHAHIQHSMVSIEQTKCRPSVDCVAAYWLAAVSAPWPTARVPGPANISCTATHL